jgi:hypothetical protein
MTVCEHYDKAAPEGKRCGYDVVATACPFDGDRDRCGEPD